MPSFRAVSLSLFVMALAIPSCNRGHGGSGGGGAVAPTITAPSSPLANGSPGVAYAPVTFTASGATPITWSVTAGALPPGMTLAGATGTYSGTPTTAGTYSFTVTATNSAGADSDPYTHIIGTQPTITGPASPLAGGKPRWPGTVGLRRSWRWWKRG